MPISTDLLTAFVKVADHLSVSAAAREIGISKGVISKRVAQLENELKTTLFSRSTRRIALTPAGEIYLEHARGALAAIAAADEQLKSLRLSLSGHVRLTAPVSWGQRVLAKLLPKFIGLHPDIEIDLVLDDRLMDLSYERVDIALRMSPSFAPDLIAVPLFDLEWVVCASPEYLARAGAPAGPSELSAHPCMSYWRDPTDQFWRLEKDGQLVTLRAGGGLKSNSVDAITEAAIAGLGVALLPLYACEDALHQGRLVKVLSGWMPRTKYGNQIIAVASPDRMRLSRNKCLLDYLKSCRDQDLPLPSPPSR